MAGDRKVTGQRKHELNKQETTALILRNRSVILRKPVKNIDSNKNTMQQRQQQQQQQQQQQRTNAGKTLFKFQKHDD
jgi:hypothetical protein